MLRENSEGNIPPVRGRVGSGAVGLVTPVGLQSAAATARFERGFPVATWRRRTRPRPRARSEGISVLGVAEDKI
jgi:hypothetical protein